MADVISLVIVLNIKALFKKLLMMSQEHFLLGVVDIIDNLCYNNHTMSGVVEI